MRSPDLRFLLNRSDSGIFPLRASALSALFALCVILGCRLRNNSPDTPPAPVGPSIAWLDTSYAFTTTATDPDGDSVGLQVSWGDSSPAAWGALLASGSQATWFKSWSSPGRYLVKARAKDIAGAKSDWSTGVQVDVVNPDFPPAAPTTPYGPDSVLAWRVEEFQTTVRGPPGESMVLGFDWGTGETQDTWPLAGAASETVLTHHAFPNPGIWSIRARARFIHRDTWSDWSGSHETRVVDASGSGWVRTYAALHCNSVARTADGGFVMAAESNAGASLIRTDGAGNLIWMRTYDSIAPVGMSALQTPDGGYVIVSTLQDCTFLRGLDIARLDTAGELLWHRAYHGGERRQYPSMYGRSIRLTSDGGFLVAAATVLMKTDSSGDSVWALVCGANSAEPLPDANIIVCGGEDGATVTKVDAQGGIQWVRRHHGANSEAFGLRALGLDGYIVTGSIYSLTSGDSMYLDRVAADGEPVWQRTSSGLGSTYGVDVAAATDGGYYVAAVTDWLHPACVFRYGSAGELDWVRALTPGRGWANSVLQTSDGECVIAGSDDGQAALFKVTPGGAAANGRTFEFPEAMPR